MRPVIDALEEAVLVADAQGCLVLFNAAAEEMYGAKLSPQTGKLWEPLNIYLPDQPDPCPADLLPLRRAVRGELIQGMEVVLRHEGGERWLSISGRPLLAENGALEGGISIVRDISARKQSERALVAAQRDLASIVASSEDAIYTMDLDSTIRTWGRGAEQVYGYTADEVIGRPISILSLPGPEHNAAALLNRVFAGESVQQLRTVRRHKDGHPVSVALTETPLRDDNGTIIGATALARDLTESNLLLEKLRTADEARFAEKGFRKLLEAAPDAILEADSRGRILLLNKTAEKMFGYSRSELLGQEVETLVPEAMRPAHGEHRSSYTKAPQTRPMGTGLELKARRKDGSLVPVEISLSPNRVGDELRVIAVVRDISARKEIEDRLHLVQEQHTAELAAKNQQLEARNRDIERANRLKSEFLASMSHELRTPLHTIIGFSELLTEEIEGSLTPKQKRFIGHILQDSRHLLELINEILDLSKIEAGRLELQVSTFDFGACLDEVLTGIRQQTAVKNINLEIRNSVQDMIFADRVRVKEILYNLLSNAVKFTPEGGSLWVESRTHDEWLETTVGDTGIGIPPEEQESIFEKFYQVGNTTKGTREGTGLGLPITRKLVELHGGKLWVESQSGQGSRFTFTIPVAGPQAAQ